MLGNVLDSGNKAVKKTNQEKKPYSCKGYILVHENLH